MPKENVSYLRLDPRIKYFAQLVARSKTQGFAEFIEGVMRQYLDFATVEENGVETSIKTLMDELWSEHEADRIALVGNRFPEMLIERERTLWERIACESQCFWRVQLTGDPIVVCAKTFKFKLWREAISIYDGMSRDEMLIEANRFSKARATIPNWYTKKASIETIRKREAKFAARAKSVDKKAGK